MVERSTIQLLRLHFSFFLLPVYLFAVSQVNHINKRDTIISFLILHLLVYPASNGYNSYMDRDESPIGGLAKPLQPTTQLFWATVILDLLAIIIASFISTSFCVGILFYIIASRAYSYRRIRLKRYPVIGFLTVFVFQGAVIFFIVYHVCSVDKTVAVPLLPCLISSLLIGALYPLTQIYQHEDDKRDGVTTISYVLGKRGSFVFSGILFIAATLLLYFYFSDQNHLNLFFLFLVNTSPVVLFFCYWMIKVWQNGSAANFKNSLLMNIIATLCTSTYFATLIALK